MSADTATRRATVRGEPPSGPTFGAGRLDVDQLLGQERSFAPWSNQRLTNLVLANGLGLILIAVGWYQSTGDPAVDTRISWLELSITGLIIAGVANVLWLLRGFEAISATRSAVATIPTQMRAMVITSVSPQEADMHGDEVLMWLPGTKRYHRRECALVANKPALERTSTDLAESDLLACEVCEP